MNMKFLLTVAAVVFCGSLGSQCCGGVASVQEKTEPVKVETSKPAKTLAAKMPRMVDLGATQCIPCKKMAPILEEMTREYAGIMTVEFIDVWQKENVEKAKQYQIEAIPTQILFDAEGKELWRHEGFISKDDLLTKWKSLGYDLETLRKTKISTAEKK